MFERDDLDLLLDSALTSYGDRGMDSGLEERILARISAEVRPAPRRRWMPWAISLAAAACLLLLVLLPARKANHSSDRARNGRQSQQRPIPSSAAPRDCRRRVLNGRPHITEPSANPTSRPELDVFPTPQPLTPEEQALAVLQWPSASLSLRRKSRLSRLSTSPPFTFHRLNRPIRVKTKETP